jgi:membrane associated rhomboid family serine protease
VFPLRDNIPTRSFPLVTVLLIAINVVVFLFVQKASGNHEVLKYGAIPCDLSGSNSGRCPDQGTAPALTALTSMFLHGGWLHIGGNMLFLWIFGNNVEDAMGKVRFVAFYLVGGFCALALQTAVDPGSTVPTIGASGAIAAVLGGYLLLYPRARVLTAVFIIFFFTLIEIPAMWFLLIWFGEQALFAWLDLTGPKGGGGVAYFAHIGGFAFGLLAVRALAGRRRAGLAAA